MGMGTVGTMGMGIFFVYLYTFQTPDLRHANGGLGLVLGFNIHIISVYKKQKAASASVRYAQHAQHGR